MQAKRLSPLLWAVCLVVAGCAATELKISFPQNPIAFSRSAPLTSRLFRPEGKGPFPAVVLLHSCGGLGRNVFSWAEKLLAEGYVVLVVDSNSPRGVKNDCTPPVVVSPADGASDAFAALAHLRSVSLVEGNRIGVMGFSRGGMAALRTASASYAKRWSGSGTFQAAVAFYPTCTGSHPNPQVRESQNNLYDDIHVPLLLLLGEADDESPATPCVEKAKLLQSKGQPVFWRLFPDATHGFDLAHLGTRMLIVDAGVRGRFTYRYSPEVTAEAWNETRAFFAKYLKGTRLL